MRFRLAALLHIQCKYIQKPPTFHNVGGPLIINLN